MKIVFNLLLSILISFSLSLHAEEEVALFESMLIMGASVSADHSAPSPGKFLAEQAQMKKSQLIVKSKSGAKSTHFKKFIENKIKEIKPDISIAVDLFFHDFKIPRPALPSDEAWVRKVVGILTENSNLVVIGNALGPRSFGVALKMNQLLLELVEEHDNLIVIDVEQIYFDIHSLAGYEYDINGKQMRLYRHQVMADAIHPNEFGSKVFTNLIIDTIISKYPDHFGDKLPFLDL